MEVRLVHAAIVEMKIDGYPVSNPIGFTGSQLELAVFNAFAPMVHLGALQSVAHRLGLQLMGVIAEPYAVATCLDPGELGDAGPCSSTSAAEPPTSPWCGMAGSRAPRCWRWAVAPSPRAWRSASACRLRAPRC
jgi:hypothetical protein